MLHIFLLQHILSEYARVRGKIHSAIEPLMAPHLSKVDDALEPGLVLLSWTSINIESYMTKVYKAIGENVY